MWTTPYITHKSRPCGFGKSFGQPIVRSFSHFFWLTKKKLSNLREFLVSHWEYLVDQISIWCTKFFFGQPHFFLVDQKYPENQKIPQDWTGSNNCKQGGKNFKIVKRSCSLNRYYRVYSCPKNITLLKFSLLTVSSIACA